MRYAILVLIAAAVTLQTGCALFEQEGGSQQPPAAKPDPVIKEQPVPPTMSAPASANPLDGLVTLKDYRAARVSSFDRTGANDDRIHIRAGETVTIADLKGPACITHIWFTISSFDEKALENLWLRAYWDGEENPSVEAPVGNFFGLGHSQYYFYSSATMAIGTKAGLNCFWRMPFRESAKITITNTSSQRVNFFYYYVDYRTLDSMDDEVAYFHARYNEAKPCSGGNYVLLDATGRGHYVGTNLSIKLNADGWWGEGDDMIYVDGETYPSLYGTGSEDYFGGAWSYGDAFDTPYFGCPLSGEHKEGGLWNVYRYHVLDPIPFNESIKVTIEHGHDNNRADDFTSVAYWYQLEPHKVNWSRAPMKNAWEVENLETVKNATNSVDLLDSQALEIEVSDRAARVDFGAQGGRITYRFQVLREDLYSVSARFVKGPDGGKVALYIDDKDVGAAADLYADKAKAVTRVFGAAHLTVGWHRASFRMAKVPKDGKSGMTLDYIRCVPRKTWVKDWLLIGPFPNDERAKAAGDETAVSGFDRVFPPEKEIDLDASYEGVTLPTGRKHAARWLPCPPGKGDYVDFWSLYRGAEWCTGYALNWVHSPRDGEYTLYMGSDDGIKVWVGDREVHANDIYRGATPDTDLVRVKLKKGWNRVLVKVTNGIVSWRFYFRFVDPESELTYSIVEPK